MIPAKSNTASKKLALKYILDNIDYRKRCLYLQEIISLGRVNKVWRKMLATFLSDTAMITSVQSLCKN